MIISGQQFQYYKNLYKINKGTHQLGDMVHDAKKVLVLSPHPDDEIIGCGGTLLHHSEQNHDITCCYMTDGSKYKSGLEDITGNIAFTRRTEAKLVGSRLKFSKSIFWDISDLELRVESLTINKMAELLILTEPDLIYAPSPFEGHPDHYNAVKLLADTIEILNASQHLEKYGSLGGCYVHLYNIWNEGVCNSFFDITQYWLQKQQLLNLYKSQSIYNILELSECNNKLVGLRNRLSQGSYAESFYRVHINGLMNFLKLSKELV